MLMSSIGSNLLNFARFIHKLVEKIDKFSSNIKKQKSRFKLFLQNKLTFILVNIIYN